MSNRLLASMRSCCAALVLLVVLCPGIFAQALPKFVSGEALVSVAAGTARSVVDAVAGSVGATVVQKFGPYGTQGAIDVYLMRLTTAKPTEADTTTLLNSLKADPRVLAAHPDTISRILQAPGSTSVPNDPRYAEQWNLLQIKMPQAWFIEKGEANVTICVVDTGVDIDHPEFAGRFDPGFNAQNGGTDPRPTDPTVDTHGTHVAGIAMAQANNGIGIAGVVWDKVRLLPINAGTENGGFTAAALLASFDFITKYQTANPNQKLVVNLSLGRKDTSDTPDLTDPSTQAMLTLAGKGVVLVCGAGNSGDKGNPPFWPANLAPLSPNILCVTATNHLGGRAYYSEYRPTTTIAAPGGDYQAGQLILSTLPLAAGGYGLMQGTSMATPHVTGGAALLLSVPGVSASDVKKVLTSTAAPVSGYAVPSPEFGYGIMDVYAALAKVAVSVTIAEPDGTGGKADQLGNGAPAPVETLKPVIRIAVAQIPPKDLSIQIDGTAATDYVVENVTASSKDVNGTVTPLSYDAVFRDRVLAPGPHTVTVSGTKGSLTVSDVRNFVITPHQIPSGRALVSFPYYQDGATPATYFGRDYRLARWVPGSGYAYYGAVGTQEAAASFAPPDVAPRSDGDPATAAYVRSPVGLGFFTDLESIKPILTQGAPLTSRAFLIPLKGVGAGKTGISWNMIGDPFPFDVPFNALLVDTPEGRLSIRVATDKGYLLSSLFSYDGANGYTFESLPNGALRAWQGHWVGVTSQSDIALVVPPAKVTRASKATAGPLVQGGWSLRISASAGRANDTYNFIGVSGRAADTFDAADVAKPPAVSPYVSVGVLNDTWGGMSGLYAQDIRNASGAKSWTLLVQTDIPDTDVTLRWGSSGNLPRNLKLTLKDQATGQVIDMRSRGFVTFHSGSTGAARRYVVTSGTTMAGALSITNVSVRGNGSRSSGTAAIGFTLSSDVANYDVGVLDATGRQIATIASRAGSAGDVHLVWSGVDQAGRKLPAGTYLVQIRAISSDGEVVKVVRPFALIR